MNLVIILKTHKKSYKKAILDTLRYQQRTEKVKEDNESVEAVAKRCSLKKVFLEISQNSQENTCVRVSFLIKMQA